MPIVYYIVREAGTPCRDMAIHRVFDAAVVCLQRLIHTVETETGFDLFGIAVDDYGIFQSEWLIYAYKAGDTIIQTFGQPAMSREYIYRPQQSSTAARRVSLRPGIAVRRTESSSVLPSPASTNTEAASHPHPPTSSEI